MENAWMYGAIKASITLSYHQGGLAGGGALKDK